MTTPNWEQFATREPKLAAWILAKRRTFDFAQSLFQAIETWGRLTDNQKAAAFRCAARDDKTNRPISQDIGELGGIKSLFDKAATHLKWPAIVLDVPASKSSFMFRLTIAGAKSKNPGSITVTSAHKTHFDEQLGRETRDYYGSVSLQGVWHPSRDLVGKEQLMDQIADRMREFAKDPAGVALDAAKREGSPLRGICCFCCKPLEDERSTAAGYGRTCAKNWELPWGGRPDQVGDAPQAKKKSRRSSASAPTSEKPAGAIAS
jgi:hypothetical protein